ncbi:hypothetical protein THMIRHAS_16590 [Thiosulfatimonas sediminis]|uniref:DUF2442 domain-containing protein n=1 Tax=Thiosulfatimonas sediminis TaxID=2675054 RepID=A0A6F8PW10_9GAMM|nr:DUF2442 domain-containing protein [Thiosulfatimonas sediminis]BBP46286.1 hypothetical protein THMIRHAS_16590 [Thiosulfatimonas sediminis]
MEWDVTEVRVKADNALLVRFKDGVEGTVEFANSFFYGVFEKLKDPKKFRQVMVVDGVVTWPGELDLAPDAMYNEIKKNGLWILEK